MNDIQVLKSQELCGRQFTVYGTSQEPLFKAKDVAEIIKYNNITNFLDLVDDDEKGVRELLTPGGKQQVCFLTEDGLYEVLMQSRKPIAKQFKKGVKAMLKEVRLNGGYMAIREDDTEESIMAKAHMIAERTIERQRQMIAQQSAQIEQQGETIEQQTRQIEVQAEVIVEKDKEISALKERTDYLDQILASRAKVLVTQIAQDYGMSAKKLNATLRDLGVQRKVNGQWILYGKHQGKGYTSSDTVPITHNDGRADYVMHTTWTQKGRLFLYELLKKRGILPVIERKAA